MFMYFRRLPLRSFSQLEMLTIRVILFIRLKHKLQPYFYCCCLTNESLVIHLSYVSDSLAQKFFSHTLGEMLVSFCSFHTKATKEVCSLLKSSLLLCHTRHCNINNANHVTYTPILYIHHIQILQKCN